MNESEFQAAIRKLGAEQAEQQRIVDEGMAAARALADSGGSVPAEDQDRIKQAAAEVVRIGGQIGEAKAAEEKRIANNEDFFRSVGGTPAAAEGIVDTLRIRDPHDIADPNRGDAEITRGTVEQLASALRSKFGSSVTTTRTSINQDAEAHALRLFRATPQERIAQGHGWNERTRELNGTQRTVLAGGTDAQGGYLVPVDTSFQREIQLADAAYGGVRRVAKRIVTMTGSPVPIPTSEDLLQSGAAKAENAAVGDVTLTFDEARLRAFMHTSGRLAATAEAIQDAGINLPMLIGVVAGYLVNRIEASRLISGTGGTAQPEGLVTAYTADPVELFTRGGYPAFTQTAAVTTAAKWVDILGAVKYAVNPHYRRAMSFTMLLNDQMDRAFATAKDADDRPLFYDWLMGNTARGMGMNFAGFNVLCDYSMPTLLSGSNTVRANQKAGFVGAMEWFWVREVAGEVVIEDPFTGASNFRTHWIIGRRMDSRGLFKNSPAGDANTPAIVPIHVSNRAA